MSKFLPIFTGSRWLATPEPACNYSSTTIIAAVAAAAANIDAAINDTDAINDTNTNEAADYIREVACVNNDDDDDADEDAAEDDKAMDAASVCHCFW